MSRHQRIRSKSGYYHIMLRGNEKKDIFIDEIDKIRFIETIYERKQENRFYLHAFCLMDNHIHLMLSEGTEDVAKVMKRITVSYVYYFNKKYKRVGHLFQDRYRSEIVEEDGYVLSLARYIHQNPIKAGIVKNPDEYKWSSYNCYIGNDNYITRILSTDTVLGLLSENGETARKEFIKFMNGKDNGVFIDIHEVEKITDEEAKEIFDMMLKEKGLGGDKDNKLKLDSHFIKEFKERTKLSIRKMAEISGVNKDKINKMLNT